MSGLGSAAPLAFEPSGAAPPVESSGPGIAALLGVVCGLGHFTSPSSRMDFRSLRLWTIRRASEHHSACDQWSRVWRSSSWAWGLAAVPHLGGPRGPAGPSLALSDTLSSSFLFPPGIGLEESFDCPAARHSGGVFRFQRSASLSLSRLAAVAAGRRCPASRPAAANC